MPTPKSDPSATVINDGPFYRVMVCIVGQPPTIQFCQSPFIFTKQRLLDGGYVQATPLDDGVMCYSDEDAIAKDLPLNREIPARAPEIPEDMVLLDVPDDAPAPGTMGVHRIRGNFMLLRHKHDGNSDYTDLTDEDIAKYTALFGGA